MSERSERGELIDPQSLHAQQRDGDAPTIVDVRGDDEYAAGHVAGARHIPVGELAGRLAELPPGRAVVTYCMMRHRGDSRGEQAAGLLRERGYGARALDGGLPAWERAGYPVERGRQMPERSA